MYVDYFFFSYSRIDSFFMNIVIESQIDFVKGGSMVAYIDLIILENLFMNYLILYTTGRLLNKKQSKVRIIIASVVGTAYVFSLCFKLTNIVLNFSKFAIGVLLVKICFRSKGIKVLIKETAVFFFTSFIYAGCSLGFLHIMKPKIVYIVNGIIIGGEYIFEILIISSIVSFTLIKLSMNLVKIKYCLNKKNMICNIQIFYNDRSIKLKALVDTGNLLTDPITNKPVVIVYKEKVRALFDNKHLEIIDALIGGDIVKESEIDNMHIRMIPYTSVGKRQGTMIVCNVDKIKLEYQDIENELNNILIGFYNEALSKNDKYSALIGLQILEGSKIDNEHISKVKSKSKYSIC